jgi:hypothetical protein
VTAAFRRLPVETFTYSAFAPAPGCGEAVVVVGGETEVWQILGRFSIHFYMGKAVLRIRDVYPGSRILIFTHSGSRIPDPKTATKERGGKNLLSNLF